MTAALPSPSGLPAVDRQWGGFTPGRAYLLVGRAGAGRSALALQAARAAIDEGLRCLVISPRPPDALVEVGRDVGLDLAAAHGAGTLRLLRIPSAQDLAARGPDGLADAYRDLARLVGSDRPARVVVEDFTPLVQFDTFERFHDAFSGLVDAVRDLGTTLVIGLGDPANDASRQLLNVVEGLVDGTIRLGAGGDLVLGTPAAPEYPSSDGGLADAMPAAPSPDLAVPASTPPSAPPAPEMGSAPAEPVIPEPEAAAPPSHDTPSPAAPPTAPEAGFATTFSTPTAEAPAPPASASAPDVPPQSAPPASAPPPVPAADTPAPSAPAPSAPGDLISTDVVPPPAPDASLLQPTPDVFGYDPADALFDQGFLVDSTGGRVLGTVGTAPPPSFAPLGGMAAAPRPTFRSVLDAAFEARPQGTPFQVVALRMDPAAPHFPAVADALRSALRDDDAVLVDDARHRAAVVLPESGPEAAQALFGRLQSELRASLGGEAEAVLAGVAAVTVSDGQPFATADDLVAYAIES